MKRVASFWRLRRRTQRRISLGIVFAAGIGLLGLVPTWFQPATEKQVVPSLRFAAYQADGKSDTGEAKPPVTPGTASGVAAAFAGVPRIGVDADTLQVSHLDISGLRKSVEDSVATGTGHDANDWIDWARLTGPQVLVRVAAAPPLAGGTLDAYAFRTGEGASLVLANRSTQTVETNARIRLPRGVYKIERLTLASHGVSLPSTSNAETMGASQTTSNIVLSRMERMQGADFSQAATVTKRYRLEPGQVCVYRCTNTAKTAGIAWYETYSYLHKLAVSKPGPARRLRRMLGEGEPFLFGLRSNSGESGRRRYARRASATLKTRLNSAHRLLLVTFQAQALAHNLVRRGAFPSLQGKNLMSALDRLSESLAEASATMLGLVPQISVSPPGSGVNPAGFDGAKSDVPQDTTVTVAFTNTGGASVGTVKLGLDVSALPSGVRCEPSDPAFFGTLRPGQTARAAFRLRVPSAGNLLPSRCIGDVSYFVAGSPAHLRPRLW